MKQRKSKVISDDGKIETWNFICEGCGAEGEIELYKSAGRMPFGCPEDCGSVYVRWEFPAGTPHLQCVVKPVFVEDEK